MMINHPETEAFHIIYIFSKRQDYYLPFLFFIE